MHELSNNFVLVKCNRVANSHLHRAVRLKSVQSLYTLLRGLVKAEFL
jgi:hypothetical protein